MANRIEIRRATFSDFSVIQTIARQTWPVAYSSILTEAQLLFMLDLFYCESALTQDVTEKNHEYFLAILEGETVGFVGIQQHYLPGTTKVHKLYILPEYQRQHVGQELLDFVSHITVEAEGNCLLLNVNRNNSAQFFYKKNGFSLLKTEDILLDFGYVMEDFVFTKSLINF